MSIWEKAINEINARIDGKATEPVSTGNGAGLPESEQQKIRQICSIADSPERADGYIVANIPFADVLFDLETRQRYGLFH